MTNTPQLTEALALALKLAPKERLQLIEQVAASVGQEIEAPLSVDEQPEKHWGHELNQILDELGVIEMKYPEIEDPVQWVKHLRAERRQKRLGNLDSEE